MTPMEIAAQGTSEGATPAWIQNYVDRAIDYAPSILLAVVTLLVGLWIAKLGRRWARQIFVRAHIDDTLAKFLSSLAYFMLLAIVFITSLGKLGVETTSFVAVLGAAGLAVGLALQGSIGNLASGVMIMLFRPFRVGDGVIAGGQEGFVEEIGVFAIQLNTIDNRRIIVPNALVTGGAIVNLTGNEMRRVDIALSLAHSNDLAHVRSVCMAVAAAHPKVRKDPSPALAVASIDNGALRVVVQVWCATGDILPVASDINEALQPAFVREKVAFAVPMQLVRQV